ncbi:hypothetical protein CC86DRAFT_424426 [Ophiobolus disseminans]|uniref:F-box domain-containing protein n=1 Tax=Ophiobolus disseminans TaxID=1469910 RepID=A0A6A7AHK9_9PLEO|nr:hypothetical protein CC86DRAFT_424426 [Ophiobolus disseminans]
MILTDLPQELLRQICDNLPCQSALDAVSTQNLSHLRDHDGLVLPTTSCLDGWKRYAVAAGKATDLNDRWTTEDLERRLPQLAALCHPAIIKGDVQAFNQLYSAAFCNTNFEHTDELEFSTSSDAVQKRTLRTWQLAQAAAFTVILRCLDPEFPDHLSSDDELQSVPWLPTNTTPSNWAVGVSAPPSATPFPFQRHMRLPLPFTPKSVEAFGMCHLPTMSNPEFFTNDTWTECIAAPAQQDQPFNSLFRDPFPSGRSFEGVIRFRLIEDDHVDHYKLQSNNFHTQGDLYNLRLSVSRRTGQMTIHHWHWVRTDFMTTEGVITSFGIVTELTSRRFWMWLWKVDWSSPAF